MVTLCLLATVKFLKFADWIKPEEYDAYFWGSVIGPLAWGVALFVVAWSVIYE